MAKAKAKEEAKLSQPHFGHGLPPDAARRRRITGNRP